MHAAYIGILATTDTYVYDVTYVYVYVGIDVTVGQ